MKMHELLADPSSWTKHNFAKDAEGRCVPSLSPDAVCWCLMGAAYRCYSDYDSGDCSRTLDVLHKLASVVGSITQYNDAPHRQHSEIIDLLRRLDV